jgi:dTDP-4-amino-4,6-dideoxygalactose transaminase
MINVTQTFFPPLEEYQTYLQSIWKDKWLTNNGQFYKKLTSELKDYLGVRHIIPMTNGTLPIQIALNALGKNGEIITTPFSYVATTSSIVWENCTPVFVDIDPLHLTIDETKIEAAITHKTTAILATHVFGNPCTINEIEKIAKRYHLKVIYDAAHCFGIKYQGQSIFNFGDVSTCSFHATKLFHTGEGGALFCQDTEAYEAMWYRHNFGHNGPSKFRELGINAKMSELQAAMGLSVLPYMQHILDSRKEVCDFYDAQLDFSNLASLKIREQTEWNYSYYPILFKNEKTLLKVQNALNDQQIFPRRYFFPSLEKLPYVNSNVCPIAEDISKRIICLPLYVGLQESDLEKIVQIINSSI